MGGVLRLLVVEDSSDDFEILLRELRRLGYEPEASCVHTAASMTEALRGHDWDVVVSDWSIPGFGALPALAVLQRSGLDLPFLIVSGTVGEETAVQALRAGAHDFLVKDHLARLGTAIERERREANSRRERTRIQEQLTISDRMASVGILAAGVAHEINNPLSAVLANLDMALEALEAVSLTPELVHEIHAEIADARDAADRVRTIVRDLKIFSRSEDERPGPVDAAKVMDSTLRMASNEIRHRARLVRKYQPVPAVAASESRLGQVFLNLVINAAQALPEGEAGKNEIRVETRMSGDRIGIIIADTGPGIPAVVMERLFAPFVTTKPAGVGTGLGLSICHRIIAGFGGEIRVDTGPSGTTFEVLLLPSKTERKAAVSQPLPFVNVVRRGKILTVDDEPMIGRAIERAIGRDHDVVSVGSGREALARIQDGARFDVIICDVMMPEITGMDLFDEVARIAPTQAAAMIFLTGGAFTTRAQAFLDTVPNQQLEKPFDPASLRALINYHVR